MPPELDRERLRTDPRYAAWARARFGAWRTNAGQLDDEEYENVVKARKAGRYGTAEERLVRDHYRRHDRPVRKATPDGFRRVLLNLRLEIGSGASSASLLDRIDDELFRLREA